MTRFFGTVREGFYTNCKQCKEQIEEPIIEHELCYIIDIEIAEGIALDFIFTIGTVNSNFFKNRSVGAEEMVWSSQSFKAFLFNKVTSFPFEGCLSPRKDIESKILSRLRK